MRIGLYFGSFNPIHTGHLIIASFIANNTDIDQVWLVVSPQNPFKTSGTLLNEYDRLHLARTAVEDDPCLKVSDVEFSLPKPSFTIDTVAFLTEKYPGYEFVIIMGSDGFQNLPKWKDYELLIKKCSFIVYKRPGFEITENWNANIIPVVAPLLEISATTIRNQVKEGKSIRYLVPEKVRLEIEKSGYFRK